MTFMLKGVGPTTLVESPRDWLDYLGAFSGLIGAVLAAVAIWYTRSQSVAAKRELVKERQLEFELRLLAEIRRQMGVTQLQHVSGYVGALIRDPADENRPSGTAGRHRGESGSRRCS